MAHSAGKRIRAGEWEVVHTPATAHKGRRLVIFGHGRGSDVSTFGDDGLGSRELKDYRVPIIYQEQAGLYSYGNVAAEQSIDDTWAWAIENLGVADDKLLFYFGSMGNFPIWNWIANHPGQTAAAVCGLPIVQFDYLHDTLGSPYSTEIVTAHSSYAAAQARDPLNALTDEIVTGLDGAPVDYWYPTNDPLQPLAGIIAFADALSIPTERRHNMGAVGHTMAAVDRPSIAHFLASYST